MMVVRFFKEVPVKEILTTISDDGTINIQENIFTPKIGKMFAIVEVVATNNKQYIDIILPSGDNESRIFKDVDTLTCSILGNVPTAIDGDSKPNTQNNIGGCCP